MFVTDDYETLTKMGIYFPYIYSSLHEYKKITLLVYLTLYNKTRYSIFFLMPGLQPVFIKNEKLLNSITIGANLSYLGYWSWLKTTDS